jgi:hypothetical protein
MQFVKAVLNKIFSLLFFFSLVTFCLYFAFSVKHYGDGTIALALLILRSVAIITVIAGIFCCAINLLIFIKERQFKSLFNILLYIIFSALGLAFAIFGASLTLFSKGRL